MANLLNYKGVIFDDWCDETVDGERRIWAEMCATHAKQYSDLLKNELDDGGTARGTCSVCGCEISGDDEVCHYYIDFDLNYVQIVEQGKKCTACGQDCYENSYPEIVFSDSDNCICEECSIDYEEIGNRIVKRQRVFPIITKSLQEAYEQGTKGSDDKTPDICGYYGRACRQLEKQEGANRALCHGCGLSNYCN